MGGGAPGGAARGTRLRPSGTLVLMNPPPAEIRMSRIPGGGFKIPARPRIGLSIAGRRSRPPPTPHPAQHRGTNRPSPPPRTAPSRNDKGNREGDGLELVPLFKETSLRRKPAKEEHGEGNTEGDGEGDAEVLSDPTAGVTCTEPRAIPVPVPNGKWASRPSLTGRGDRPPQGTALRPGRGAPWPTFLKSVPP